MSLSSSQQRFADLCDRAERNGLEVQVLKDAEGRLAVWVFPRDELRDFTIGETSCTMQVGVVASPFVYAPPEAHANQLDQMLEQRGYR